MKVEFSVFKHGIEIASKLSADEVIQLFAHEVRADECEVLSSNCCGSVSNYQIVSDKFYEDGDAF